MRGKIPQPRFEVTINSDGGVVSHVIVTEKGDEGGACVFRAYERKSPVRVKIKPLGVKGREASR